MSKKHEEKRAMDLVDFAVWVGVIIMLCCVFIFMVVGAIEARRSWMCSTSCEPARSKTIDRVCHCRTLNPAGWKESTP